MPAEPNTVYKKKLI